MKDYCIAEYIKGKRSFSHFVPIIFPFIVALLGIPFSKKFFFDSKYYVVLVYNWFPVMFLPLCLILISYQAVKREIESHTYNYYPLVNKGKFWLSKVLVASLYSLCLNMFLALFTILIQLFMYDPSQLIIQDVIASSLVLWLSTLFIIPLTILIAVYINPFASIVFNFIGIVISIFFDSGSNWFLFPWSYGVRLITPIIKVNPNGTLLEPDSPLNTFKDLPWGIAISVLLFIVLTILTSKTRKKYNS